MRLNDGISFSRLSLFRIGPLFKSRSYDKCFTEEMPLYSDLFYKRGNDRCPTSEPKWGRRAGLRCGKWLLSSLLRAQSFPFLRAKESAFRQLQWPLSHVSLRLQASVVVQLYSFRLVSARDVMCLLRWLQTCSSVAATKPRLTLSLILPAIAPMPNDSA